MSEEQPTFKVKDRRLFNPDGTPREIERDEAPDNKAESTSDAAKAADARIASSPPADLTERDERAARPASTPAGGAQRAPSSLTEDAQTEEDIQAEEDVPGADDPASFINFLMSIASNAAASLGMMEHPATGQRGVDLQLAKHWIDVLGMLQQKTRGNLAAQEEQIFEGLLADLRLQYVTLTTKPPAQTRGFTGRDIIGGK
jgi:hypothetical protein